MSAQGAAPEGGTSGQRLVQGNDATVTQCRGAGKPVAKWRRVLRALLNRQHLNRFQAERDPEIRDHVLPTSIADLQRMGLRVDRRLVRVPGFGGSVAVVAEYSLPDDQREAAERILATSRSRGRRA